MNATIIWGTDWLWPFVLAAMALVVLFTGTLAWSAATPGGDQRSTRRAWLLALAVPLVAMALYATLGHPRALNPRERHPVPDESAATMVSKLADRLKAQPDNPAGWLMLARSYQVLQRYADSADAWEHAKPLAWDDVEAMTEWTEARILSQDHRFDPRSQELLARAMSLDPSHPGVLMLRALSALDRGDAAAATRLLTALRDLYPEGSADREALDAALDQIAAGQDPRRSVGAAPAAADPAAD